MLHLAVALTWLVPVAVAAQAPPGNQPAPRPDDVTVIGKQNPKMKLVCERFVPTGSIKSEKICKTQAEFDQIRADSLAERERLIEYRDRMRAICQNRDPPTC